MIRKTKHTKKKENRFEEGKSKGKREKKRKKEEKNRALGNQIRMNE
jgi:hypothetical protein